MNHVKIRSIRNKNHQTKCNMWVVNFWDPDHVVYIFVFSGMVDTYRYGMKHSLLTELLEDEKVAIVYHLCAAVTLGCVVNSIFQFLLTDIGYIQESVFPKITRFLRCLLIYSTLVGFRLLIVGFGKFHIAAIAWLTVFLTTSLVFFFFKLWYNLHRYFKDNSE